MKTVCILILVLGAVVSLKTTAPQAALFVNTDEMGQEEQLRRSRQVDQTVKTILEWLQGRYTRRATEDNRRSLVSHPEAAASQPSRQYLPVPSPSTERPRPFQPNPTVPPRQPSTSPRPTYIPPPTSSRPGYPYQSSPQPTFNEPSSPQPSRPSYPQPDVPTPSPPGYPYQPSPQPTFNEPSSPQPSRPSYPQPDVPTPSPPGYPYQPSPRPTFNEPSSPQPSRPSYPQPDVPTPSPPGYPYQPSPRPNFNEPSSPQPSRPSYPQPDVPKPSSPGYPYKPSPQPSFPDLPSSSQPPQSLYPQPSLTSSLQPPGYERPDKPSPAFFTDNESESDSAVVTGEEQQQGGFDSTGGGTIVAGGGSEEGSLTSEGHPPHIHQIDVQCAKDQMTINLEFNTPFDGVIYSKGFYSQQACRYVQPGSGQSKYSFTVRLDSCGTQFIEKFKEEGQAYLENVLVLQNEPGIQEVWDTVRRVRCLWEGSLNKALSVALSVGMLREEAVTFSGDTALARLDIQMGRGPFAPAANGLVKIGETMTLVVSVEGDPGFDIQVRDCVARDSTATNVVQLTDERGCVIKKKLFGAFQKTRETGSTQTSIIAYAFFQAFKFPDIMDLTIDCNVELCKTDCEICPDPNQSLDPVARRKRDLWMPSNDTLGEPMRIVKSFRVVSAEDLVSPGLDTVINVDSGYHGVCMSFPSFLSIAILLLFLLLGSCLLSAILWLKQQGNTVGLKA